MKTRKSISKRLKVTANKKLLRRHKKQNHFNARDRGYKTRKKRQLLRVSLADKKRIKKRMLYI